MTTNIEQTLRETPLRLDARKPLFVLTISPGDPELPDELTMDYCYVVFNDMDAASRFAHENAIHPLTHETLPWRLTILAPCRMQSSDSMPGPYDRLYDRLFGVCMVHAVFGDPSFKSYSDGITEPAYPHNHAHTWPIVVSLDYMADLCAMVTAETNAAFCARHKRGLSDYSRMSPASIAAVRMFTDYWKRIRRTKASLTACQHSSNLIKTLIEHAITTKEESKYARADA